MGKRDRADRQPRDSSEAAASADRRSRSSSSSGSPEARAKKRSKKDAKSKKSSRVRRVARRNPSTTATATAATAAAASQPPERRSRSPRERKRHRRQRSPSPSPTASPSHSASSPASSDSSPGRHYHRRHRHSRHQRQEGGCGGGGDRSSPSSIPLPTSPPPARAPPPPAAPSAVAMGPVLNPTMATAFSPPAPPAPTAAGAAAEALPPSQLNAAATEFVPHLGYQQGPFHTQEAYAPQYSQPPAHYFSPPPPPPPLPPPAIPGFPGFNFSLPPPPLPPVDAGGFNGGGNASFNGSGNVSFNGVGNASFNGGGNTSFNGGGNASFSGGGSVPTPDRSSDSEPAVDLPDDFLRNGGPLLLSKHYEEPDASVNYYPDFLSRPEADALFQQLLHELEWRQRETLIRGEYHKEPRLTCWYGVPYTYAGVELEANHSWHPVLAQLKDRLATLLDAKFNSLLCNLYRSGRDSIGWHADDEKSLGRYPLIASISLGYERQFEVKTKRHPGRFQQLNAWGRHLRLPLRHGSLLVMRGAMQVHWLHSVPKDQAAFCDPEATRINLTFRCTHGGS